MIVLFLSALLLAIIFLIGWLASIKLENASIVDAIWALTLGIPVFIYITSHEGYTFRKILLFLMAIIWSLRLGIHLAKRIYKYHPEEDSRYKKLRKSWGNQSNRNFLVIFLINALLIFFLSLPFYFSTQYTAAIQLTEWIGLAIFVAGFIGESLADHQLAEFKKQAGSGKICNIGLWNYSRHPNYFFEAVIWIGIYIFCAASPNGVFTIHAPTIMIFLLTKVTGIPPTERSLLKSRGDAYKQYQESTSSFIPWFKSNTKIDQ